MIPFDQLNSDNHQISELSKVLSVLIEDREICDTQIVCDLFERYTEKVMNHMDTEDKVLYSKMLSHPDRNVNATASRFLEGSKEIKRIFRQYTQKWCAHGLHIYNHDLFLKETREMFQLVQDRILKVSEELYPMARRIEAEALSASA